MDLLKFFVKEFGVKDSTELFIAFLAVVVSTVGIFVTGVFSWLLWRATQQTNKLAMESLKLSKIITQQNELKEERIRYQHRLDIVRKFGEMQSLLIEIDKCNRDHEELELIHSFEGKFGNGLGINSTEIGLYFSDTEGFLLKKFWEDFLDYKQLTIESSKINTFDIRSANILQSKMEIHKQLYNWAIEITVSIGKNM